MISGAGGGGGGGGGGGRIEELARQLAELRSLCAAASGARAERERVIEEQRASIAALDARVATHEASTQRVRVAEVAAEAAVQARAGVEADLAEMRRVIAQLEGHNRVLASQLSRSAAVGNSLKERAASAERHETEAARLREELDAKTEQLSAREAEAAGLRAECERQKQLLGRLTDGTVVNQKDLQSAQARAARLQTQVVELEAAARRVPELEARGRALDERARAWERRVRDTERQLEGLVASGAEHVRRLDAYVRRQSELETHIERVEAEKADLRAELRRRAALGRSQAELERHIERVEAEKADLREQLREQSERARLALVPKFEGQARPSQQQQREAAEKKNKKKKTMAEGLVLERLRAALAAAERGRAAEARSAREAAASAATATREAAAARAQAAALDALVTGARAQAGEVARVRAVVVDAARVWDGEAAALERMCSERLARAAARLGGVERVCATLRGLRDNLRLADASNRELEAALGEEKAARETAAATVDRQAKELQSHKQILKIETQRFQKALAELKAAKKRLRELEAQAAAAAGANANASASAGAKADAADVEALREQLRLMGDLVSESNLKIRALTEEKQHLNEDCNEAIAEAEARADKLEAALEQLQREKTANGESHA